MRKPRNIITIPVFIDTSERLEDTRIYPCKSNRFKTIYEYKKVQLIF